MCLSKKNACKGKTPSFLTTSPRLSLRFWRLFGSFRCAQNVHVRRMLRRVVRWYLLRLMNPQTPRSTPKHDFLVTLNQ